MNENCTGAHNSVLPWWKPVVFAAMAGGLGWGIRGQYGHETGAMIAGLLVSLILVFLLCPGNSSLQVVRAVALGTIAMGFGGSMTYGQTIGLTQNPPVIGNDAAYLWGMLGLAIKGGLWIAFAGYFLGLGLGGKRYQPLEMLFLVLGMLCAALAGWWLFNTPHDPLHGRLPWLYFSDNWYYVPALRHIADHEFRPELWGALLGALVAALAYAGLMKKDLLACKLALWGLLGGAIGFPLGQCVQAANAWHPDLFASTFLDPFTRRMNWWNLMETIFGFTMGGFLGLGLWRNRHHIALQKDHELSASPFFEVALLLVHLPLLALMQFSPRPWIDAIYDFGILLGLIPLVACIRGRYWPYLLVLPVTLLPIAGQNLLELVYGSHATATPAVAWTFYAIAPMLAAILLALWGARREIVGTETPKFILWTFLFNTWIYFWLNWAIFEFPWPWREWTWRTANGVIFTLFACALTAGVLLHWRSRPPEG